MSLVEIAMHGGIFQRPVHALNLSVCPGMVGLGKTMVDVVCFANPVKQKFESVLVTRTVGKLYPVIGQDGVNPVGNCGDEPLQESNGNGTSGALMQFSEDELGCAINGNEEVKFPFVCSDFSNIDMKVANGIGLETFLDWLFACFRQTTDAVPLKTAMQGRAREVGYGVLQRVQTVIQRQQRMFAKGHNKRFFFSAQHGRLALSWSHLGVGGGCPSLPFCDCFRVEPVSTSQCSYALLTILDCSTDCLSRCGASV